MKPFAKALGTALVLAVAALSQEPAELDPRLPVSTLVREDVFAGFLGQDTERLARAEKHLEQLLTLRPDAKTEILAWQAGATLYRAVLAHKEGRADEFDRLYRRTQELFSAAAKLDPASGALLAVQGGASVLFADRLPEKHRAAAWNQAYESYSALYRQQEKIFDRLPVHHRGEVLSGLAQSAQRTGRTEEHAKYLDMVITTLPNTSYAAIGAKWKADPTVANKLSMTCQTCHDAGKLAARRGTLQSTPR